MEKEVKSVLRQEVDWAYIGLVVCLIFVACGIGLIVSGAGGGAFKATGSAIFVCVLAFAFLGFATFLFIQCLKRLIPHYKSLKALRLGTEDVATICGHTANAIKHHGRGNLAWNYKTYYSVHLRFFDENGKEVIFKTGLCYNQEQFKQLSAMPKVKIKRYKNSAVIVEEFYDPLDYDFSELPKKLRIQSILVVTLSWISLALMIAGITSLCVFNYRGTEEYNKIGLGILFSGTGLIIISAILKSFIYIATEKFVKNELPYARRLHKKKRWKEMEDKRKNKR